ETLTELGDERGLAVACRCVARALFHHGRLAESVVAAERALVHAEACGDQDARRQAGEVLGYALCHGPTPVSDAIRRCEELLLDAGSDRVHAATITRYASVLHAMAGGFEDARRLAKHSELLLEEVHHPVRQQSRRRSVVAEAKELEGDLAGAEEVLTATW